MFEMLKKMSKIVGNTDVITKNAFDTKLMVIRYPNLFYTILLSFVKSCLALNLVKQNFRENVFS